MLAALCHAKPYSRQMPPKYDIDVHNSFETNHTMLPNTRIKQPSSPHSPSHLVSLLPNGTGVGWIYCLLPSVLVRAIIKSSVHRDPDRPDSVRFGPAALRPRADGNRCRSAERSIRTGCVKPARQRCAKCRRTGLLADVDPQRIQQQTRPQVQTNPWLYELRIRQLEFIILAECITEKSKPRRHTVKMR